MKQSAYADLVTQRQQCRLCIGLENPAAIDGGQFDSNQIGPWSRLHGDLDAQLMVVGQDWADIAYLRKYKGLDDLRNPTMRTLGDLLASIGIDAPMNCYDTGPRGVFLTNAVLCMKTGGLQGAVQAPWFTNCGTHFLRRQVEIVRPHVVVPLGERAYRALCDSFNIKSSSFRSAVEGPPLPLMEGTWMVPVYHCGNRILNTHRKKEQQLRDWQRVALRLHANKNGP